MQHYGFGDQSITLPSSYLEAEMISPRKLSMTLKKDLKSDSFFQ